MFKDKINPRVQRCVHCVQPNSHSAVSTPDGRLAGVSLCAGTGLERLHSRVNPRGDQTQPPASHQPATCEFRQTPCTCEFRQTPCMYMKPVRSFRCSMSCKDQSDVRLNVFCQSKYDRRTRCNHLNRFVLLDFILHRCRSWL